MVSGGPVIKDNEDLFHDRIKFWVRRSSAQDRVEKAQAELEAAWAALEAMGDMPAMRSAKAGEEDGALEPAH
jgi:hypothetical protein